MKRIGLLLLGLAILPSVFAKNIDSLIQSLPGLHDTDKIHTCFGIALTTTYDDPATSEKYTKQALRILRNRADTNVTVFARLNTQLGVLEKNKANFNEAAIYQHKALKIHERIGEENKRYLASVYNDLGIIYKALQKWGTALKYYKKSNQICAELGLMKGVSMTFNNIGTVLLPMEKYDSAAYYYEQAFQIAKESNDLGGMALTLNNQGELLVHQGNRDEALLKFKEALKFDRETGDQFGIVLTLVNIGNLLFDEGRYKEAEVYFAEGYEIAKSQQADYILVQVLSKLSLNHMKQNKFKEAYFMLREEQMLKDSIFNEKKNEQIEEIEAKYQTEKKEKEIELQSAKLSEQDAELAKKKTEKRLYLFVIIGAIILLIGSLYGWYMKRKDNRMLNLKNQEIHHQKELVDEKNKEITDSIQYAKRIQSAILPPNKLVKEYLKDSFIIYKPKDIVAGDFYWLEHKDGRVLFAAADCTGHGVPGAMVSVVCNNGLNRSVREHGLTDPGKILDKTREIVIKEFEKSEEEVKDGMDIALCSLEGTKLHYAGAHNPLWIIRNESSEIEEIKADKQPIGQYQNPQPYTSHGIELQKGDTIYIFSDGYADQFGGEKGKKFKSANFKRLLLSIREKSMLEQKSLIDQAFEKWKGGLEQLDDVCVIGVRI